MEYLKRGHTQKEAQAVFGIGLTTIKEWKKLQKETGSLEKRPLYRKSRKIDLAKLAAAVAETPDAYLKELAEPFGCTEDAVSKALIKMGITRKKRRPSSGSAMKKSGKDSSKQ